MILLVVEFGLGYLFTRARTLPWALFCLPIGFIFLGFGMFDAWLDYGTIGAIIAAAFIVFAAVK